MAGLLSTHEHCCRSTLLDIHGDVMPDSLITQLNISRERSRALAQETVRILQAGFYITASGTRVDIRQQVNNSVLGTVSYPPENMLSSKSMHNGTTVVEVRNETTFAAAKYLMDKGMEPAALNFASATSPGGGFLKGARAQEEYLSRSSSLWSCLHDNAMYPFHSSRRDPFYSDYVIYSPDVIVLRDDSGDLLERPYPCSIITSPAVNASDVRRFMPYRLHDISSAMWSRILKVLAVAERHTHKSLVLGAWGCGAFGNDGDEIATLLGKALEENFCGAFDHVVFAITDWSEDEKFIGPFKRRFGK